VGGGGGGVEVQWVLMVAAEAVVDEGVVFVYFSSLWPCLSHCHMT
jgi:hypothetical protein